MKDKMFGTFSDFPEMWTTEMIEFVKTMLSSNPEKRPSADEVLSFLKN